VRDGKARGDGKGICGHGDGEVMCGHEGNGWEGKRGWAYVDTKMVWAYVGIKDMPHILLV